MKKILTLGLSLAAVATVVANTINWSLTNFEVTNADGSKGKLSDYKVFLLPETYTITDGVATTAGTAVESSVINYTDTVEGSADVGNLTGTKDFLMALYAGDKYYALTDGSAPVVINYDSAVVDPYSGAFEAGDTLMGQNGAPEGKTYRTMAAVVPEPATAVLALAGIAMLIRRRRS